MSYQRDYSKRLNIAMVGIGSHTYRNLLPAFNYLPVNLKAICNRSNEELGQKTAAQYGCNYYSSTKEMYEKEALDAVFLCVSPKAHPALAMEAFEAGLHVWMEKPVGLRVSEVESMINARNDRVCVVGLKKAFMPSTEKAVEIANSPDYGNLKSILAVYPMSVEKNGEEILRERTVINWLNNGCHPMAFLLRVGGKVSAVTVHRGGTGTGGVCVLEFENGVVGNFHMASGPFPMESYHLFGDKWHLEIDNCAKVTLERGIPSQYGVTTNYVPEGQSHGALVWQPQNSQATLENQALFTQGMYDEMKYFCDCILEGRQAEIGSLEFALEIMKVYEAVLLSDGQRVAIQS